MHLPSADKISSSISAADVSGSAQDPAQQRGIPPIVTVLLSLSVLWCLVWFIHSWGYWEDDSFIHLEFARSLASGHGFSFNGALVYGDTAPLWVMLLAGMHFVLADWILGGKILALLGVAFTLPAVYVFSRRLTVSYPYSQTFSAAMVLFFVINPYFCYWSYSGMETISAAGLALWTVVAATARPLTWQRFLMSCILAGIAPLLRPEMAIFTAIVALVLLYRRFIVASGESLINKVAGFFAGLALISGPTLLWAIYAVHTFGRVIPNTNAAKRAPASASVTMRILNVYGLGYPIILFGLIVALVLLVGNTSRVKERLEALRRSSVFLAGGWIFVLWTVITLAYYIVNHTYVQTRYVLVSAAGLTVVVLACVLMFSARAFRLSFSVVFLLATAISVITVWPFIRNKDIYVSVIREQAVFVHALPPDAPVADYNIGEIAFFSEHPIIDTGGITRPGAIPYLESPPEMLRWIHSEGAAYYVTDNQPEPGAVLVLSQPIPFFGWTLNPRKYLQWGHINLWKLAPRSSPQAAAATPPSQP